MKLSQDKETCLKVVKCTLEEKNLSNSPFRLGMWNYHKSSVGWKGFLQLAQSIFNNNVQSETKATG